VKKEDTSMKKQTNPLKTRGTAQANMLIAELRKLRAQQARLDRLEARIERLEPEFGIKPPKADAPAPAKALHGDDLRGQIGALEDEMSATWARAQRLEARQNELETAVDKLKRAHQQQPA
jgi:prefoldin subunit 5